MYRFQTPGGGHPPPQQPWPGAQPPPQQPWTGPHPSHPAPQHAPTGPRAMRQSYSPYPSQNHPLGAYPPPTSYVPTPWGAPQLGQGSWRLNHGIGDVGFPQPTAPRYPSYPSPGLHQVPSHAQRPLHPSGATTWSSPHVPTRSQGYPQTERRHDPRQQQTAHSISRPMRSLPDHLGAWKVTRDELEPGMVVQLKENKKGWSSHPGIVLGWNRRDVVTIIQVTGFGPTNPHIKDRFLTIKNPYVVRNLASAYLLIADQENSPTHFGLPMLRLEDGMFMPKRSYVNCLVVLKLHVNKLMHFTPRHKFERRCLTRESMQILREHRVKFAGVIEWQRQQNDLRQQKDDTYRVVDY